MGVPAMQLGKVGGDKLTVKTARAEFLATPHRTDDAWWKSICPAEA